MNELIWYSFPGILITLALSVVFPDLVREGGQLNQAKAVLLGLATPLVGFFVHQLFRLAFELAGGFSHGSRTVLGVIREAFSTYGVSDNRRAFVVWEMTFYGKDTPDGFRDHVRRSWHHILSFWGMALAGFAGFLLCVVRIGDGSSTQSVALVALADLAAAVVFTFKGKKTYDFLREQEVAFFRSERQHFDAVARALTQN